MILYNVTVKIDKNIEQEWLTWMIEKHIPAVLATNLFFNDYQVLKLLDIDNQGLNEDGNTYAIQYSCPNLENLMQYRTNFAPALQAEHTALYGGHFVAFRTILEVIK